MIRDIIMAVEAAVVSAVSSYTFYKYWKIAGKELKDHYKSEFGFYPAAHLTINDIYHALDTHERRLKPKPVY